MERIAKAAVAGERCTTSALAVHGVMTGTLDSAHRYRLNALDLVVPDGQPVRWALGILHGIWLADRVYGPELTIRVLRRAAADSLPVYLYGSRAETLDRLSRNLQESIPRLRIAGSEPSKFRKLTPEERSTTLQRITSSGAKLLVVGLGCPRQEVFAYEMGDALAMPVLAVGAAFDFHAGTLKQAPRILQRFGLEWAFRLLQEPKRLWRRYLLLNPLFVSFLLLQRLGGIRLALRDAVPPANIESFG